MTEKYNTDSKESNSGRKDYCKSYSKIYYLTNKEKLNKRKNENQKKHKEIKLFYKILL